jgi:hypothetical protein
LCRRHKKMAATLSLPLMDDRNANQTWATTLLHASMYAMVVCHKKWYVKVVWRLVRKRPFGREYAWTRIQEWHKDDKDDMSTTFSLAVEISLPSKEAINVCKSLGIHTAAFGCECFWSAFRYRSRNSCQQWPDNVTHSTCSYWCQCEWRTSTPT